jgi:NifU-like domain
MRKQEVQVELLGVEQNYVRVRAKTSAHACGSTSATVKTAIEDAVYETAPEVVSLAIEGLEGRSATGFVRLDQLVGSPDLLVESKAGD